MSSNDFPVLDGITPSYADIKVTFSGTDLTILEMDDIKSINTGTTVEVGEKRGASGGRVMKRTTGSAKYEASATLYREGYQKLLRQLKGKAPLRRGNQRAISLVHFQVKVSHTPPGSTEVFEYVIKGCRLLGRDLNSAEGNDADTVDIKLNPIEIADIIDGEEVVLL